MRAWLRPCRRDGGLFFSGVAIVVECASPEHTHAARSEAFLSALPDLQLELTQDGTCFKFRGPPGSLGLDAPEGRRIEELLPAAAARSTLEALGRAQSSGQLQLWELEMTTPARGARIYEARLWPMSAVDFVMLLRDVSEARRARAELVAAREAALESSRHTTQFLANFSHEIRTPLSGILSVTQLLRTWSLPKEGKEYLDVLQSAGESLLAIVSDVLDLSKIEANRLDLEADDLRRRTTGDGHRAHVLSPGHQKGPGARHSSGLHGARAGAGRREADPAARHEPRGQRGEVHRRRQGRGITRPNRARPPRAAAHGARLGAGHRRRTPRSHLRGLRPSPGGPAAARRNRPGPLHRPPAGPAHGR